MDVIFSPSSGNKVSLFLKQDSVRSSITSSDSSDSSNSTSSPAAPGIPTSNNGEITPSLRISVDDEPLLNVSLHQFLKHTSSPIHCISGGTIKFELSTTRVLCVTLNENEMVWIKSGILANTGGVKFFTREGMLEHGMWKAIQRVVTSEDFHLTKAMAKVDNARVFLSDMGKRISVVRINTNCGDHSIIINENDIVAFDPSIKWSVVRMKKLSSVLVSGFFAVKLKGTGSLALSTLGDPFTLRVRKGSPIYTDYRYTVAWSSNIKPSLHTDVSFKTLLGRGSGESIQMKMEQP